MIWYIAAAAWLGGSVGFLFGWVVRQWFLEAKQVRRDIQIVTSAAVPKGELWAMQEGKIVGKITGLPS